MPDLPLVAVIADAHFHDLDAGFDFPGIEIGGRRMAVRSWADTRQSTRVFNESAKALVTALDEVVRRKIRHVVLLGDYSDDGQRETLESVRRILDRYSRDHGLNFYALPGNHDIFGPQGRHHTKEFLGPGGERILISSDPAHAGNGALVSANMYCEGYPAGLDPMAAFGYFRQPHYIHWETPFGSSGKAGDRLYDVASPDGRNRYRLMDASYLVEPEPGLWLMMIDANVFEPRDGDFVGGEDAAFIDSTGAGWNALLRLKPFIIDWIADVSQRARTLNKTVLAFSHYPALDPFDGATGAERVLFGETNVVRRTPRQPVADALLKAGMAIHFSGHLHVEGVTRASLGARTLTNIAVPSLVAFPPAFKVLEWEPDGLVVDTVELTDLTPDPDIAAAYRREADLSGTDRDLAFTARSYGAYLVAHKRALVHHRYFPKEWPGDVVAQTSSLSVADLCILLGDDDEWLDAFARAAGTPLIEIADIGMIDLVVDWYCLRQASELALDVVPPLRLRLYRSLAERFGRDPREGFDGTVASFLSIFLGAFAEFIDRAERGSKYLTVSLTLRSEAAA